MHKPAAEVAVVDHTHHEEPQKSFHQEYTLKDKLGKGSFAQVHLAQAVPRGNVVAVKITDMRAAGGSQQCDEVDRQTESLVLSEVAALRRVCAQPHCVAFQGAYIEGCLSYIVMERCDMTLLQALESNPELTERTLVRIIREMLQALDCIHKLWIAHRDIKPDNFLLVCTGRDPAIKLCDFGFAVQLPEGDIGVTGVFGTAPFMSPEMLRKDPYGTKTDVWSLGVLAYVLLCGQFPYHPLTLSSKAMKAAIVAGTPQPTFQPADSLDKAGCGARVPPLDAGPHAWEKALGDDALQLSWLASSADSQQSDQPLWPMLNAAKSVGAFDIQAPKDLRQGNLDIMLASLQAKHQRDLQGAGGSMASPTCDSLQSTCANTYESADDSFVSSELGSQAPYPSSHPTVPPNRHPRVELSPSDIGWFCVAASCSRNRWQA
eukprot:CAMPEP_0179041962 /NCGR_PEP_ID=MMETSP0796-20121207/16423_1 /TAXON_ID=73915 /ORGANISM="Pyrodinium bahamense, Strain pbaha01" /LENGTH=431 /DNA_ID=CAMNT_0020738335 /DNA_START=57 /DNA_END=1353 /DNA_ORIENTATION=+